MRQHFCSTWMSSIDSCQIMSIEGFVYHVRVWPLPKGIHYGRRYIAWPGPHMDAQRMFIHDETEELDTSRCCPKIALVNSVNLKPPQRNVHTTLPPHSSQSEFTSSYLKRHRQCKVPRNTSWSGLQLHGARSNLHLLHPAPHGAWFQSFQSHFTNRQRPVSLPLESCERNRLQ